MRRALRHGRAGPRIVAATALLAAAGLVAVWWWRPGAGDGPALPLVAGAIERSGTTLAYAAPDRAEPALVAIGTPPTPIDVTAACESDETVAVFLYESGAALRLVEIDKASAETREIVLTGAELTYHPRTDRRDPAVIWVPTAQSAGLFRYDARDGGVRKVIDLPEETHVFGFDQDDAGALYLGTYPGARCLRVDVTNEAAAVREVEVNEPEVSGARYLRGIFATADALLLHYMSPGVLVRHDLATGASGVLLRAGPGKLRFRAEEDRLRVSNGAETLHFDRRGPCPAPAGKRDRAVDVDAAGDEARVSWDGGRATISLLPRAGGMRITCLGAGGDGAVYGGTYWNTWLFRIDPDARSVSGLGALPDASGEFFTIGWAGDELVIPHYQGVLFYFDPTRPFSTREGAANPRRADAVPGAHFGLSCVTDAGGRLVYATMPNYDQPRGMLVVRDADGTRQVHATIGDGLTLGHLVSTPSGVFGSTIERFGLGLRDAHPEPAPSRVVRLDVTTGRVTDSVALGVPFGRDVRDLVAAGADRLLAVTKYDLHRVEVTPDGLRAVTLRTGRLLAGGDEMVALATRDAGTVLVLTKQRLAVVEGDHVRVLCRLPIAPGLLAVDGHQNLWMAEEGGLFLLPAGAVTRLLRPDA